MEQAVQCVRTGAAGDRPYLVLVTNANKAWQAARDALLRDILDSADLAVPEWAMAWAGRRLGLRRVQHVGGITLMVRLLAQAQADRHSVFLLGAAPDVLAELVSRLRRERPLLRLAGFHHGYFGDAGWEDVVAAIGDARPHYLFVALGSPAQEYRISELAGRLPTLRVAMGVGGSFDVLAGRKKDAPGWARGRGLEWLYRLAQDPRRMWRRYLVTNTWFIQRVIREGWRRRR